MRSAVAGGKRPASVKVTTSPARSSRAYPYGIYDIGTHAGLSMWEPTMTPALLPWPPFADGGAWKADASIRFAKTILDHGRRRRKQRVAVRLWKFELQKFADQRSCIFGLSLSSRHQQMEQDRTPGCFPYLIPIGAGTIADYKRGQAHRQDNHGEGLASHCRLDRRNTDRTQISKAQMEHSTWTQQVSR